MPKWLPSPDRRVVIERGDPLNQPVAKRFFMKFHTMFKSLANLIAGASANLSLEPVLVRPNGNCRHVYPFPIIRVFRFSLRDSLPESEHIRFGRDVSELMDNLGRVGNIFGPHLLQFGGLKIFALLSGMFVHSP